MKNKLQTWSRIVSVTAVLLLFAMALPVAIPQASAASSIRLSQATTAAGNSITVTGYGYSPGDTVAVFADFNVGGAKRRVQTATSVAANGTFSATLAVPGGTYAGNYTVTARDFHGNTASQSLRVLQTIVLQPGTTSKLYVTAGHEFFLVGKGFGPSETVNIAANFPLYSGNTLSTTRTPATDKNGTFAGLILRVPYGTKQGTATLSASGATSKKVANANLYVAYHPTFTVQSKTVRPGTAATVIGQGFVPGYAVRVSLTIPRNGTTSETLTRTVTPDQVGNFTTSINVPANAHIGSYSVSAVDTIANLRSSAALTVAISAAISVKASTLAPGQAATIVGAGFGSGVPVTISATVPLYSGGNRTVSKTVQTNGQGGFTTQLAIPANAAAGRVTITASSSNGHGSALLNIQHLAASVTISPASVIPGGTATVQGSGYLAGDRVTVSATVTLTNGAKQTLTTTATTNARGQFSASLRIPGNVAAGTFVLVARSAASGRAPITHFSIAKLAPSIVAVPTTAAPGTKITVNGFGFAAGEAVNLDLNGQRLGSATTDAAGKFSVAITVPSSMASGTYPVSALSASGLKAAFNLAVNRQVSTQYYIASLYTGQGYHEYITFLNPGEIRGRVTITYEPTVGGPKSKTIYINPHSRFTEDVNADLGVHVSASAAIAADVPIAATRMDYHGTALAVDPGVHSTSTVWYFANGNTSHGYREYVAVGNSNASTVQVALHVQPTHHKPFTIYRNVGPHARTTFKVNSFVKDAVGIRVTANGPIVANRTDYIHQGFMSKTGVMKPQRNWYFAAGPHNAAARNWIAVTNTSPYRAFVTLRAYGPAGRQVGIKQAWLRPQGRAGYLTNRLFHQTNVSVVVTSSRPVVAEQMTYAGRMHHVSSDVFGIATPSTSWAFPATNTTAGATDGLDLFNPNVMPIPVVVQFYTSSGQVTNRTYVVNPFSQAHIDVNSVEPNAQLGLVATSNYRFVAMNRSIVNNGTGGDVTQGVSM